MTDNGYDSTPGSGGTKSLSFSSVSIKTIWVKHGWEFYNATTCAMYRYAQVYNGISFS